MCGTSSVGAAGGPPQIPTTPSVPSQSPVQQAPKAPDPKTGVGGATGEPPKVEPPKSDAAKGVDQLGGAPANTLDSIIATLKDLLAKIQELLSNISQGSALGGGPALASAGASLSAAPAASAKPIKDGGCTTQGRIWGG